MEQLNKIELRSIVGNVRMMEIADQKVIRFSFATNYGYKDRDGNPVIETTWHQVTAWKGPDC